MTKTFMSCSLTTLRKQAAKLDKVQAKRLYLRGVRSVRSKVPRGRKARARRDTLLLR
jgi:hypothetical protein